MPVPRPPRMYAGRMISGSPICSIAAIASSNVCAVALSGTARPISIIACLKISRSSAVSIAIALAPIISGVPGTPISPWRYSAIAVLRPVWPPSVASTASGFSRSMIAATTSGVIGSM